MKIRKLISVFLFCAMNAGEIFSRLAQCPEALKHLIDDFRARHPILDEFPEKIVALSKEPLHTPDELKLIEKIASWAKLSDFEILTLDEVLHAIMVAIYTIKISPRDKDEDFAKKFIEGFKSMTKIDLSSINPMNPDFKRIADILEEADFSAFSLAFDDDPSIFEEIRIEFKAIIRSFCDRKKEELGTMKDKIAHVFKLLDKPELHTELGEKTIKIYVTLDDMLDSMATPECKQEFNDDMAKLFEVDPGVISMITKIVVVFEKVSSAERDEFIKNHSEAMNALKEALVRFRDTQCQKIQDTKAYYVSDHYMLTKFLEIMSTKDYSASSWCKVTAVLRTKYFTNHMQEYSPQFWKQFWKDLRPLALKGI